MQRRSWIILTICIVLALGLFAAYVATQSGTEKLTQEQAIDFTQKMEVAFRNKNANGVLAYIAPASDTRITNLTQDQLHVLLVRYFRNSDRVSADLKNYLFLGGDSDATLQFDLVVHNDGADSRKEDYTAHINCHLRRVPVPHLLGLYQTKEWRISGIESTGPDLATFGD